MPTTLLETNHIPQPEYDLPALLMRLDANQTALWRCHPGVALYPTTRISPQMREAIHRYRDDLWHIARWWGIKSFIRSAPMIYE
jgi:hypothetical protein